VLVVVGIGVLVVLVIAMLVVLPTPVLLVVPPVLVVPPSTVLVVLAPSTVVVLASGTLVVALELVVEVDVVVGSAHAATPSCRQRRSVCLLQRRRRPPSSTQRSIAAPHESRHSLRREIAVASTAGHATVAITSETTMRSADMTRA
jgi:hypothetical protein